MFWVYFSFLNIITISLLLEKLVRRSRMIECNIFFTTRVSKGFTQMDVSRLTGISQATISQIEKETYFNKYSFEIIKKLCDALCIDIRRVNIF